MLFERDTGRRRPPGLGVMAVMLALLVSQLAGLLGAGTAVAAGSYSHIVNNNPNYSLKGAKYGIWKNQNCTGDPVAILETLENGVGLSQEVDPIQYWAKEISPSPGYLLDETVKSITVVGGQVTQFTMEETPVWRDEDVLLVKMPDPSSDVANTVGSAMGNASVAGAQYRIDHYNGTDVSSAATRGSRDASAIFATDENGRLIFSTGTPVSGTWPFRVDNKNKFPLGGVIITEVKPAPGFVNDGVAKLANVRQTTVGGPAVLEKVSGWPSSAMAPVGATVDEASRVVTEPMERVPVLIEKLERHPEGDGSTVTNVTEGLARIAGTAFRVTNLCDNAVKVDGKVYQPGQEIEKDYVTQMITADMGYGDEYVGHAMAVIDDLPMGKYSVRESAAPTGHLPNVSWTQEFTIEPYASKGQATPKVGVVVWGEEKAAINDVIYGGIAVTKMDSDLRAAQPQGDGWLKGFEYTITLDAQALDGEPVNSNIWVRGGVKGEGPTDAQGNHYKDPKYYEYAPGEKVMTIVTNDYGYAATDKDQLPFARYVVTETKAPECYQIDTAWKARILVDEQDVVEHTTVYNDPTRGGVKVNKWDLELDRDEAQGDATMEGAEFSITNDSLAVVVVDGVEYAPGEVCATIVTGADGIASTSATALPYGTYTIRETKAPEGYLLNEEWSKQFEIRKQGEIVDLTATEDAVHDQVIRGDVAIGKIDAERGDFQALGAATLEGARFNIINRSGHSVNVDDTVFQPGQVVKTITTAIEEGGRVVARTENKALPYGTYELVEAESPKGYYLNKDWSKTFSIRNDGELIDYTDAADSAPDQVMREDFHFQKKDDPDMGAMANVVFAITSNTTGERHIIVTDENGTYHSISTWNRHEVDTNANDAAVTWNDDGTYTIDESKLNPKAGTWFFGTNEENPPNAPEDSLRAFPFDTYTMEELRCAGNQGHKLVTVTVILNRGNDYPVWVDAHEGFTGYDLDYGTIDNQTVKLATMARHAGRQVVPATADASLVDTVSYMNLDQNHDYVMKATVYLVDAEGNLGEALGTGETQFKSPSSHGTVDVDVKFDASELGGRSAVVYEELWDGRDLLSWHKDPLDEDQTVSIPGISTSLGDVDGNKECDSSVSVIELTDRVSYSGLTPGDSYTLNATLHVRDKDGNDAGVATDKSGKPITATTSFVAEGVSGTVDVKFSFVAPDLAGTTVVSFEELLKDGETYAVHADINDEAQTVHFPRVGTQAQSDKTGDHVVIAGDSTLSDVVAYENVTAGETYRLVGRLMEVGLDESGKRIELGFLSDDKGEPLTFEGTFVAEGTSGTTTVPMNFDGSELAGKTFVVYEDLYLGDRKVASENDPENENQSAYLPEIGTKATGHGSTSSDVAAGGIVSIDDTVSYSGLLPGKEYRLVGELVLLNWRGWEEGVLATSEMTFTPETSSGEVVMTFEADARDLDGRSAVAHESLYLGNTLVREHADNSDEAQTIHFPKVATTLLEGEGHTKSVEAKEAVTLVDTLAYENLTPGVTYVVTGKLMDKSTGAPLTDTEGNVVYASTSFTPEANKGTVELTFEIDARGLAGRSLVAFERVTRDDYVVAIHEDLEDESQTVHFAGGDTTLGCDVGHKMLVRDDCESIIDVVRYKNLVPGLTYVVTGTLHVADYDEEGKLVDEGPLLDASGNPVTKSREFVPQYPDGEVQVVFDCDTRDLAGKKLVAYERITLDGRDVLVHEDIEDAEQTVMYPDIKTSLTNNGSHSALAQDNMRLVDTVSYKNLMVGEEFTMRGELFDGETGESLGITAETTFVPTSESGTVDVVFEFDASEFAGRSVVAHETLIYCGDEYARHDDPNDPEQTVSFGTMATVASAGDAESGQLALDEKASIKDVVSYTGLVPGEEYTVTGRVMSRATGEEVIGEASSVTTKFTPTSASGNFPMAFTVDTRHSAGDTFVVFETIRSASGTVVCDHSDLSDDAQAVRIGDISTVLTDGEGKSKNINPERSGAARDTVSYRNLVPGETYRLRGKIVSAYNESTVYAEAEKEFSPTEANGMVEVNFTIDTAHLKGETVVAFERLEDASGRLIAVHEDLYDEDQRANVSDKEYPFAAWMESHLYALCESKVTDPVTQDLIDRISYVNLEVGKTYVVESELHAYDADDNDLGIVAEQTNDFECHAASGTFDVTFKDVDLSKYAETRIVAFERLYAKDGSGDVDGECAICEEDASNECQTIRVTRDPERTPADISIEKFATPSGSSSVKSGDTITYTLRVRNDGETAGTVTVQDVIPEGTSLQEDSVNLGGRIDRAFWVLGEPLSVTWLDLSVGGLDYVDLTFTVRVDGDVDKVTNVATWTDEGGKVLESNAVSHIVEDANLTPDIVVKKSVVTPEGTDPVQVGENVTYRLTVENRGQAEGTTTVEDALPAGTTLVEDSISEGGSVMRSLLVVGDPTGVRWEGVTVAPGESRDLEFSVTVIDEDATSVDNVATYVDDDGSTTSTNHVVTPVKESFPDPTPDPVNGIVAKKSAYPRTGSTVFVGDEIEYFLTFDNTGDRNVHGVGVYDNIPEGTEYVRESARAVLDGRDMTVNPTVSATGIGELITDIPAGSTCVVSFKVKVLDSAAALGEVHNVSTWQANQSRVPTGELSNKTTEVVHYIGEPGADIVVHKEVSPEGTVEPGSELTYRLIAENHGRGDGTTNVHDLIPAGSDIVEGSVSEGGVIERTFWVLGRPVAVRWDNVEVKAGKSVEMSFKVKIADDAERVANKATYTDKDGGENETNEVENVVSTKPAPQAQIAAELSVDKTTARVGDEITYTITIRNRGNADGTTDVSNAIPAGTSYVEGSASDGGTVNENVVNWTGISVGAGKSVTRTFKVRVDEGAPANVTNVATYVTSGGRRTNTNDVTTAIEVAPAPEANITVSKSVDKPQAQVGDTLNYTITVVNDGDGDGTVTVFDAIPEGTTFASSASGSISESDGRLTWTDVNVGAGETVRLGFSVTVDEDAPETIENVATYRAGKKGEQSTNTVETVVKEGESLVVSKTADPESGSYVKAGDVITYSVEFRNGTGKNVRNIGIYDVIPEGTAYVHDSARAYMDGEDVTVRHIDEATAIGECLTNLPAGSTCRVSFQVRVLEGAPATITNQATWAVGVDGVPTAPLANTTNEVHHLTHVPAPEISVTKLVDKSEGVVAGDTLEYMIVATNNGDASGKVSVSDTIPAGTKYVDGSASEGAALDHTFIVLGEVSNVSWSDVEVAPGTSVVLRFSVTVLDGDEAIRNVARWTDGGDEVPTNETVTERKADDAIVAVKTADPESGSVVSAGDVITYRVSFTNTSDKAVSGLGIFDTIPEGTEYVADSAKAHVNGQDVTVNHIDDANAIAELVTHLDPGVTVDVTFSVRVLENAPVVVLNRSTWDLGLSEVPSEALSRKTNEVNHVTHVPAADVSATKSVDKVSDVKPGDELTYTISVSNKGDAAARVNVSDAIPAGTKYVEDSASEGATVDRLFVVLGEASAIKWDGLVVNPGETVELSFKVTVLEGEDDIVNVARWTADDGTTGDTGSTVTTRENKLFVTAAKASVPESGSSVKVGDKVSYTLTFTNGGRHVYGFGFYDAVPAGLTLVDGSAKVSFDGVDITDMVKPEAQSGAVSGMITRLSTGSELKVTFDAIIGEDAPGVIENVGTWAGNLSDRPTGALGSKTNTVTHIIPDGLLEVSKSVDKAEAKQGDTLTYTIKYANVGGRRLNNVGSFDKIPAGTTYVKDSRKALVDGEDCTNTAAEPSNIGYFRDLFDVAPGSTVELSFSVRVNADASDKVTNVASWAVGVDGLPESDLPNKTNEAVTKLPASPTPTPTPEAAKFVVTKSVDKAEAKPGDALTYTIEYRNEGNAEGSVAIADQLPGNVTLVSDLKSDGGAINDEGLITWDAKKVEAGKSGKLTFTVKVNDGTSGTVTNVATYVADGTNGKTGEAKTTITNGDTPTPSPTPTPTKGANLKVGKVVDKSSAKAGDTLTYTITITNDGTEKAESVGFFDAIPSGTTYVAKSLKVTLNGTTPAGFVVSGDDGSKSVSYIGLKDICDLEGSNKDELKISFQVKVNDNFTGSISNTASADKNVTTNPTGALGTKSNTASTRVQSSSSNSNNGSSGSNGSNGSSSNNGSGTSGSNGSSGNGTSASNQAKTADKADLKTGVDSAVLPVMVTMVVATAGAFAIMWRVRKAKADEEA